MSDKRDNNAFIKSALRPPLYYTYRIVVCVQMSIKEGLQFQEEAVKAVNHFEKNPSNFAKNALLNTNQISIQMKKIKSSSNFYQSYDFDGPEWL